MDVLERSIVGPTSCALCSRPIGHTMILAPLLATWSLRGSTRKSRCAHLIRFVRGCAVVDSVKRQVPWELAIHASSSLELQLQLLLNAKAVAPPAGIVRPKSRKRALKHVFL